MGNEHRFDNVALIRQSRRKRRNIAKAFLKRQG
jgi:hypothetical protein